MEFVIRCDTCKRCKPENVATPRLLQPLNIPRGLGRYLNGFYRGATQIRRSRLHYGGRGPFYQIWALYGIDSSIHCPGGGQNIPQPSSETTWNTQGHSLQ